MNRWIFTVAAVCIIAAFALRAEERESAEDGDSSAGLPKQYAGNYLVAARTVSPDKKFAVIYPKAVLCDEEGNQDCKNCLVQLKPFKILGTLQTKWPHFQNKSHGGISADWSNDSSVALVTLESKWGPSDIFLYEFKNGELTRSTNLLGKVREQLVPDFHKAKPDPYNDVYDFIFEGDGTDVCRLEGATRIRINALATTDPKHTGGTKAWDARMEGVWEIPFGRFTSQRVTRLFAGVRKEE